MKKIIILLICMIVACSIATVSADEIQDPYHLKEPTPYSTWSHMYRAMHNDLHEGWQKIPEEEIIQKYEAWCTSCHFKPIYDI